jgi:hypothetical protein
LDDFSLLHYPMEDKFYCYVPVELTLIFAAHCYSLSKLVGDFDILPGRICNYLSAGGIEIIRQLYFAARGGQLPTSTPYTPSPLLER